MGRSTGFADRMIRDFLTYLSVFAQAIRRREPTFTEIRQTRGRGGGRFERGQSRVRLWTG